MTSSAAPLFEFVIIPRDNIDLSKSPMGELSPLSLNPVPAWLHRSTTPSKRLAIWVPGAFEGTPMTGRHDFNPMAAHLEEKGVSFLLPQMSSAQRNVFARFETAAEDLASVIAYAKSEGFEEIALIANSMGGPRAMYWYHLNPDPIIKSIFFISTIESSYLASARTWTPEEKAAQDAFLDHCADLVASGKGEEIVIGDFFHVPLPFTAAAYLSFLGRQEETNASTVKWFEDVTVPTAFLHSANDIVSVPEGVQAMHDALVHVEKKTIFWHPVAAGHQLMMSGAAAEETGRITAEWVDESWPAH